MFNILKSQISAGDFRVKDMRQRISRIYALGDLTEEQLDELLDLMAQKANPENERPETLALIHTLAEKVDHLTARVKELEKDHAQSEDETPSGGYPDWEPWDGLSSQYQQGAVVRHTGQLWQSTYPGQNVWEPGTVDDRFWIKYPDA